MIFLKRDASYRASFFKVETETSAGLINDFSTRLFAHYERKKKENIRKHSFLRRVRFVAVRIARSVRDEFAISDARSQERGDPASAMAHRSRETKTPGYDIFDIFRILLITN